MSLAIHIVTHASQADVEAQLAAAKKIAAALDKARPEGAPEAVITVYGNDYSDPANPVKDIRQVVER